VRKQLKVRDLALVAESTVRWGDDGRNVVTVRELIMEEDKARELARTMSGGVTAKAVARARELLEEAGRPVR